MVVKLDLVKGGGSDGVFAGFYKEVTQRDENHTRVTYNAGDK